MSDNSNSGAFNSGNYNYTDLSFAIRIDPRVSSLYEDQTNENVGDYHFLKSLYEDMYTAFQESEYKELYKDNKPEKSDEIKIYYYFKNILVKKNSYALSDIFMVFCEFFQLSYDRLYNNLGVLDKECILKELNEKYQLNSKIKNKRLF